MTTELRPPRPADMPAWFDLVGSVFGDALTDPEDRAKWTALAEPHRSVSAWDDDELVGTAGTFGFRMTVPGGAAVPAAGVTMVTVKPTHRRRGVLTSMMRRQLDDLRAWGEPLAVLTASEPDIYRRYGYGVASEQLHARIDTGRVRFAVPPEADALRLRLVDAQEAKVRQACEALYARRVPERAGMLERQPGWERVPVHDSPASRDGASPLRCVLAERDGELRGYARYAVRPGWNEAGPDGEVVVRDLEALDPAAHGALVRYLCGIDLMAWVRMRGRPVDDPWLHMVSDVRRCGVRTRDAAHLRMVSVAGALEARTYAAPLELVLEVEDSFCPWNAGRWRLTGGPEGAKCTRTEDAADLALTVDALGAAYLGGPSLRALAAAGRVRELREGALSAAAVAFRGELAPWLPHGF
jgi:predicted acetyltransferase